MPTALITGVCGFCGAHLVERLRQESGMRITGVDIRSEAPASLSLDGYVAADIRDPGQVAAVITHIEPDLIFHLAGIVNGSATDVYQVNFLGGINLIESVRLCAPQARVLIVGSAAEYGYVPLSEMPVKEDRICNPSGAYALSKYALTLVTRDYARQFGLKVVIVRPFNIIGPGIPSSLVVGAILKRTKQALTNSNDPEVAIGNLDTERDFIAVNDTVDAYTRLLLNYHTTEIFNICSGTPRTIRSIAEELLSFSPRSVRITVSPSLIRANDVKIVYGSWEKINLAIGFNPQTNISDALHAAWRHEMERD